MEFNGISNEIQSGRLFSGEIQEIPSKVLLTFRGGLLIRTCHYILLRWILGKSMDSEGLAPMGVD